MVEQQRGPFRLPLPMCHHSTNRLPAYGLVASVVKRLINGSRGLTYRRILLVRIHHLHVGIPETASLEVE